MRIFRCGELTDRRGAGRLLVLLLHMGFVSNNSVYVRMLVYKLEL